MKTDNELRRVPVGRGPSPEQRPSTHERASGSSDNTLRASVQEET